MLKIEQKKVSQREREKKKKMIQTWEASFWNNLKRPMLTQTHEYNSHILCRAFFFLFTNASLGLQPWKMSAALFLEWLDPYVTKVEKNNGDFIYLTTCGHPDGVTEENKQIWKHKSTCVHGERVKESEERREGSRGEDREDVESLSHWVDAAISVLAQLLVGSGVYWLCPGPSAWSHSLLPFLSLQNFEKQHLSLTREKSFLSPIRHTV